MRAPARRHELSSFVRGAGGIAARRDSAVVNGKRRAGGAPFAAGGYAARPSYNPFPLFRMNLFKACQRVACKRLTTPGKFHPGS
jgi:hypothetical protein